MTLIRPYRVEWLRSEIEELRAKVRAYEMPRQPSDAGWQYGVEPEYLNELRRYWADGYDFERAQDEANRWPQFIAEIEKGVALHFVHIKGEAQGRRPLLMAHGWPSSVYDFWKVVEPLAYPSRHGGKPEDAFDLVLPTLPGYGASFKPDNPVASEETARWYDLLMKELGYETYFIHGADIGADVAWHLAAEFPESLRGLHLNDAKLNKTIPIFPSEFKWIVDLKKADQELGAYFHLHQTRPSSLAYAMQKNPVAQMAWIVERFHDWSDLRERSFEEIYTKDELLNYVMNYYMNDSFATSLWFYYARGHRSTVSKKVKVPTGASLFPDRRTPPAPKSFMKRNFNLIDWKRPKTGGHFAALEEPQMLIEILRSWAKKCEPSKQIFSVESRARSDAYSNA